MLKELAKNRPEQASPLDESLEFDSEDDEDFEEEVNFWNQFVRTPHDYDIGSDQGAT